MCYVIRTTHLFNGVTELSKAPLFTDVKAVNAKFAAGDRILALVKCRLSNQERGSIVRTIIQFTNAEVDVMVIDQSSIDMVYIDKHNQILVLSDSKTCQPEKSLLRTVTFSLGRVVFDGGQLAIRRATPQMVKELRRWAGDGVEVVCKKYI